MIKTTAAKKSCLRVGLNCVALAANRRTVVRASPCLRLVLVGSTASPASIGWFNSPSKTARIAASMQPSSEAQSGWFGVSPADPAVRGFSSLFMTATR
ncbi:hypothetical protein [Ruegeria sediminis]|uniref:hypothetical protein n=1 Tax=Ruegeria sediminis TaxID=2583820 RepID=UPI001C55835D|nr:hypothetical protein [Ruegeria sediminis]